MQPTLFNTNAYKPARPIRRLIRDLPATDRPETRLQQVGPVAMSTTELLALVINTSDALDLAYDLIQHVGDLAKLVQLSVAELCQVDGIGPKRAQAIQAAIELGRRVTNAKADDSRPRITSPADAANLLMSEMQNLDQEHLVVILLDTRNRLLGTDTVYKGSLNTSVVRIGELFKAAIKVNAAAILVTHNHPSGDPSPSPEDVKVTRQIRKAADLLDISLLDHIIFGRQRFTSLKEHGLGFSD